MRYTKPTIATSTKRLLAWIGIFCANVLSAAAQPDFGDVELKATPVRGNIYMINGTGGNMAVSIGQDGTLLVDSKFAPLAERVRALLADLDAAPPKYILNTHFHGDHIGGNHALGAGVPIIAHANVRQRLMTPKKFDQRYIPPPPTGALPTLTLDQSLSLHFNGEEIKATHFPQGHTDGDIAVFFTTNKVVHLGDLFFNQRFPFVDLDYGGEVESLIGHIAKLTTDLPADIKIIPGHGPLGNLDDLKTYHRMLVETSDTVRQAMAAGKSLDQIKAAGLPATWQTWDWAYVPAKRWIETIYWSYARQQP